MTVRVWARQSGPCAVDGCGRDAVSRGWCRKHYGRWWRTGDPLGRFRLKVCVVGGCGRAHHAGGWCVLHYNRVRDGRPVGGPPLRVDREGVCEFWGCGGTIHARRLCAGHYAQVRAGRELTPLRVYAVRAVSGPA